MAKHRKSIEAVAYLRTSSATNVGGDKDSDKRQRAAIAAFAKAAGYTIVAEFYDAAVSGADPIVERSGFKAMLDRIAGNGVRCILVESPDRGLRSFPARTGCCRMTLSSVHSETERSPSGETRTSTCCNSRQSRHTSSSTTSLGWIARYRAETSNIRRSGRRPGRSAAAPTDARRRG